MGQPVFHLRPALRSDRAVIRAMITAERLNPMGIDWSRFLLAQDEQGQVVGCAQIKPHGDGTRELASLVVLKPYRGQGLAGRLIEALMNGAPPPLYLTCRSGLASFYARFGFRTLADEELSPYFRRLKGLVRLLQRLLRFSEGLAVMIWEGD